VSRLANGQYVFLGRADHQIKVLGHRVELGEIEAALRGHPGVEHAVACGWPMSSPTTAEGIVAFVTGNNVTAESLIATAKTQLPAYIVPRQVFILGEMPFNANGKVDRRVLAERLKETAASANP
jgi:acyl-coenzyme A synthetase/AMP-(fatty) acid ligase